MSGQVVRDVVIRVSVESGSVNLDAANSATQSALAGIQGIGAFRQRGNGRGGGAGGGYVPPGGLPAGAATDLADRMTAGGFNRPYVSQQERWSDASRGISEWSRHKARSAELRSHGYNSSVNMARGVGHLASASGLMGPDITKSVVAIEGLTNVAKSAQGVFEAFGAAGLKLSGGFAILAGEILLTKKALDEAYESSTRYFSSMTGDALRKAGIASQRVGLQSTVGLQAVSSMPFTGRTDLFASHNKRYHSREAGIRAFEATDAPLQFKNERRAYLEHQDAASEQIALTHSEMSHTESQLEQNRQLQQEVLRQSLNRKGAMNNALGAAEDEIKHATHETYLGTGARRAYRALAAPFSLIGLNGGIGSSGYTQSQEEALQKAKNQHANIIGTGKADAMRDQVELNKLKQQELELTTKLADQSQKVVSITREQQQAAYSALQTEKERVRGVNISFGRASVAEQNMALRLQAKHRRIKAKQEQNIAMGRDRNEGVERYNHFELTANTLGGDAEETINQQAEADAIAKGFAPRNDLAWKERKAQEAEQANVVDAEKKSAENADKVKQLGKDVGLKILDALHLEEFKLGIDEAIKERENMLNDFRTKSRGTIQ